MIEVYKYGGNLLKDEKKRKEIYAFLKKKVEEKIKIIMVVSAWGREKDCLSTDYLSKNNELLEGYEKDRLLTFGEIYSSLIIKNELLKEGFKVSSVDYDEIGIMCDNNYQDGNIENIDMSYLKELVDHNEIVVVPGFIGESMDGKIISLGRNTSDLTAVIIGDFFKTKKVNIIKEVKGIYKVDPSNQKSDKIIRNVSYDEMLSLIKAGSTMFSKKTIKYAKDKEIVIEVRDLYSDFSSVISNVKSEEKILFVDKKDEEIKVVFNGMEIFNEIFKNLINKNIKLEDLIIEKDIVYLRGNTEEVSKIVNSYL